jgi:hypothetical protein
MPNAQVRERENNCREFCTTNHCRDAGASRSARIDRASQSVNTGGALAANKSARAVSGPPKPPLLHACGPPRPSRASPIALQAVHAVQDQGMGKYVSCTEQRCCSSARGRLGGAVAVGMGNTLGPGETGRRCMFISRGGAIRGLTGVPCGKRRGPRCGVCAPAMHRHNNISRKKQAMAKRTAV